MTRFLPHLPFWAVAFAPNFLPGEKIDEAIPMTGDSFRPVFVRMEDQLFRKAGDHETFCKAKSDVPRSTNRKEVTALLRKKADNSWEKIKGLVEELKKAGSIRGSRRFWIVNGFSCVAKPEAIRDWRFMMRYPLSTSIDWRVRLSLLEPCPLPAWPP